MYSVRVLRGLVIYRNLVRGRNATNKKQEAGEKNK